MRLPIGKNYKALCGKGKDRVTCSACLINHSHPFAANSSAFKQFFSSLRLLAYRKHDAINFLSPLFYLPVAKGNDSRHFLRLIGRADETELLADIHVRKTQTCVSEPLSAVTAIID